MSYRGITERQRDREKLAKMLKKQHCTSSLP